MARTAEEILAELNTIMLKPITGPVRTAPPDYGAWARDWTPIPPKSSGRKSESKPLWQQALGVLDRGRSAVVGALDALSRGYTDFAKLHMDSIQNPIQGRQEFNQWISEFGDVLGRTATEPAKAAYRGITGKEQIPFENILTGYFGMQDTPGKVEAVDVLGFAGDLAFDPLMYVTFGAGSALKAGASAAEKAAGRYGARTAEEAAEKVYNETIQRFAGNPNINSDLVERLAIKKANDVRTEIENVAKAARARAQNALINLDIPFTNITQQFGKKPAFLTKNVPKVGTVGAAQAADILRSLGAYTSDEQINLLRRMGIEVDKLDDLNVQQFQHLQNQADAVQAFRNRFLANDGTLKNNLRNFMTEDAVVGVNRFLEYQPFRAEDFLSQLDPRIADRLSPFVRGLESNVDQLRRIGPEAVRTFGAALGKMPGTIKGKTADAIRTAMDDVAERLGNVDNYARIIEEPITESRIVGEITPSVPLPRTFNQFVQDAGGRSVIGDAIGRVTDMFNPRTLGVRGEGVVNNAANYIRDAEGKIYAGMRNVDRVVNSLRNLAKNFSNEEKKQVEYLLENAFPDGYNIPISQRAKELADQIRPIYAEIADAESKAGLLKNILPNYAPHIISKEALLKRAEKYAATDPDFAALVNKSTKNPFSKERRSFQSFAELDNAIARLENAKSQPGANIEEIQDKINILSNLFNRDPIDALGKRYAESIKIRAVKELQDSLRKDGLLKSASELNKSPESTRVSDQFVQLSEAEAKALNLDTNTVIHKDILEALKKVDSVFTAEGIEKLLKTAEQVQNIWRSLVTTYVPSHHFYNLIGNIFNNTLAGVTPKHYVNSGKLLWAVRKGTATPKQIKLYEAALENGVLHQGFISDFMDVGTPQTRLEKISRKFYDNKLSRTIYNKYANPSDNLTRLALFLHSMEQTGSVKLAAQNVRKYLFNYREMTRADRTIRAFVPFWNWTKNNVPLQIEKLAQQPRTYALYVRLKDMNQGDGSDMRDYARESQFRIPALGVSWDPRLPLSDLDNIFGNSVFDPLSFAISSTSPLIRAPIEMAFNKNAYTGRVIDYNREYGDGTADPAVWGRYALNQLGVINRGAGFFDEEGNIMSDLARIFFGTSTPLEGSGG